MQYTTTPFLTVLLLLLATGPVLGQQAASNGNTDIHFRSSVLGSSRGALPFWLHANRNGTVDSSGTNWINEIQLNRILLDRQDFSLQAGGSLVGRLSNNNSAHFSELYLQADWKGYRFSAGRFIDPIGFNNHELSAGSMMVSRNTTPVPRISISTPDFLDLPFAGGYLQYKGMFSYGWLEENRYVSNALLHQKYLYLKVNLGNFSAAGGMIHNVVWGGTHPEFGPLPQSFGDFLRVVAGQNADEESNAPGSDISNALGNAVAAYEFGLNYETDSFTLSATRLFYLEDRVSTRFRSPWDGVWGVNLVLKDEDQWLNAVTYEHVNTKKQDALPGQPLGRANYYNNGIYQSGWTYEGKVLGLPLLGYSPEINRVSNNILVGHHLGAEGSFSDRLSWKLLLSYTRNYGDEYVAGNHLEQFSAFGDLQYSLPGMEHLKLFTSLAMDAGELYPGSLGLRAGIAYRFR